MEMFDSSDGYNPHDRGGRFYKKTKCVAIVFSLFFLFKIPVTPSAIALETDRLRCEYLSAPVGIQEESPRLSWVLKDSERAQRQSAYQIKVSSSREKLSKGIADLWDTGKVSSNRSQQHVYGGGPLSSRERCFWKVRVWDQDDLVSRWSETATWSMGLLEKSDWEAQWIGFDTRGLNRDPEYHLPPPPYLRKEFNITKQVRNATLYVTAQGLYEVYLNGSKVGDDYFTPGWSNYSKRVFYFTYDVTDLLMKQGNAIGAILANGWYAGYVGFIPSETNLLTNRGFYGETPALLLQLEIQYEDGSVKKITSDPSWKASTGPILSTDIQMGESYDSRKEMPGWTRAGFAARNWAPVSVRPKMPVRKIAAYPGAPVRRIEEIKPREIIEPEEGVFIFDLGQNFSGRARLKVKGKKGIEVKLRFGEMLHADNSLMTENLRSAKATDTYILKGGNDYESWEPTFTYHGFRYVEVTGFPGRPGLDAVTGVVLHSDLPMVGSFNSSNPMINKLYQNILWSQRANFFDIPTDCPQRDERLGWTGDAQLFMRSASYNMDVSSFFTRWLINLNDDQLPSGAYPNFAPMPFLFGEPSAGWMDAGIICPSTLYEVYGDQRVIKQYYPAMQRFMEYLLKTSTGYLRKPEGNSWGDWLADEETSRDLVATAYFAYDSRLMAEMAESAGKEQDAVLYRDRAEKIRRAFTKKFMLAEGILKTETQAGYALALNMDLIPASSKKQAGKRLVSLIKKRDWHLATGFLGTRHLLPSLSKTGNSDVAYKVLNQKTFPSLGFQVANGATTIWEHWDAYSEASGFKKPEDTSFNHYVFGSVLEWMFSTLAGIDTDGSAFKRIIVKPDPDGYEIDRVSATYDSIQGKISSAWERKADRFALKIEIPANSSAIVYIPCQEATSVVESGVPASTAPGVTYLRMEDNRAVYEVQSGTYAFHSSYRPKIRSFHW